MPAPQTVSHTCSGTQYRREALPRARRRRLPAVPAPYSPVETPDVCPRPIPDNNRASVNKRDGVYASHTSSRNEARQLATAGYQPDRLGQSTGLDLVKRCKVKVLVATGLFCLRQQMVQALLRRRYD